VFQDGPVIISGDKNGRIVVARPFGKGITSLTKVKAEVTCISTVTYNNTNYAAIGYANGLIFIEEITEDLNLKTVYQIASDNDPIQSLDWQKRHDPTYWPLLAFSTKRLKRIAIYQFPSQTLFTSIRIPNAPAKSTEQQRTSLWIELSWSPCYDNKIYLSSYVGTILVFDVTESGAKICNTERLEKHSRNVFTINWYNQGKKCITTSIDKQVIKWDVKKKSCLQIMKTQAGFPYALDISPLTPHQMAVGMGDNAIKLWEFKKGESVMSNNKDKYHDYYKSTIFWKQLYGKIQSVSSFFTKSIQLINCL
jgi:WD40 repeat protein